MAQRAVDMLTKLSEKADRRMWMWEEEEEGMGWDGMDRGYKVHKPLVLYEPCPETSVFLPSLLCFPTFNLRSQRPVKQKL